MTVTDEVIMLMHLLHTNTLSTRLWLKNNVSIFRKEEEEEKIIYTYWENK